MVANMDFALPFSKYRMTLLPGIIPCGEKKDRVPTFRG